MILLIYMMSMMYDALMLKQSLVIYGHPLALIQ